MAKSGNKKRIRGNVPIGRGYIHSSFNKKGMERGLRQVDVFIKGPGAGREAAIRSLQSSGLEVLSIRDVTPIPHNGCRPSKRRRV